MEKVQLNTGQTFAIRIPKLDFIKQANATFKLGVHFKNWSQNDFLHTIDPRYSQMMGDYFLIYGHLISYTDKKLQIGHKDLVR